MENNSWLVPARKALDWFIEEMGEDEWRRRRNAVADYFHSLGEKVYTEEEIQRDSFDQKFSPIAVYSDWMSWYMYLVESVFERQGCDDPFQSARIYPFFATIGFNIDMLKNTSGIRERLRVMFNVRQNKPDSTLFELAVACLYLRNGWQVYFLEEQRSGKTPDMEVMRNGERLWVECKRLEKVTDFANFERAEWQKRVKHLFNAMRLKECFAYAEISFKVPVGDTDEHILGAAFYQYFNSGMIDSGMTLVHDLVDFRATRLDLNNINASLADSSVKPNSPMMIATLIGDYDLHGSYTQLLAPKKIDTINPDNKLWVLNDFYGEIYAAYLAKWECTAESSIDQKAKDVKKMLSKALSQIPDQGRGVVHIGYETVLGPVVELQRQKKIKESIESFNFGNKHLGNVFCHAMQLMPKLDGLGWAETTLTFGETPDSVLRERLLLNLPIKRNSKGTHWG
jgi:hypothetical protein